MANRKAPPSPDAAQIHKILASVNALVAGKPPRQALQLIRRIRLDLVAREGELQVAQLQQLIDAGA